VAREGDRQPKSVTPSISGTIEEVLAYVDGDLTRAQEAYDLESGKSKPRATLINSLIQAGAKPTVTPVTPDEGEVTPAESTADSPSEGSAAVAADKEAEQLLEEKLGAVPIAIENGTCETCEQPIDDQEIGLLSRTRFGKWQCTKCYIAQVSNK